MIPQVCLRAAAIPPGATMLPSIIVFLQRRGGPDAGPRDDRDLATRTARADGHSRCWPDPHPDREVVRSGGRIQSPGGGGSCSCFRFFRNRPSSTGQITCALACPRAGRSEPALPVNRRDPGHQATGPSPGPPPPVTRMYRRRLGTRRAASVGKCRRRPVGTFARSRGASHRALDRNRPIKAACTILS